MTAAPRRAFLDPSNAVVHLTLRRGELRLAVGSGVLYRRNEQHYIVTAWHNVTGRHSETLHALHSQGALPDNAIVHICCWMYSDQYAGYTRRPFVIPLEDSEQAFYLVHRQGWPRVDVVAIPIDPRRAYDAEGRTLDGTKIPLPGRMEEEPTTAGTVGSAIECIQDFENSGAKYSPQVVADLGASDDIFIVGYPHGITDISGQPVWKRATVASNPRLGWNNQPKFLIDCASRKGMSGAPAITYSKRGEIRFKNVSYLGGQPIAIFHGIYVGRADSSSDFEAQIGTVWQKAIVDEIIDGNLVAPHSTQLEATPADIHQAIEQCWPAEGDYASKLLNHQPYVQLFSYRVLEHLRGRANPAHVSARILEFARARRQT